MFPAAGHPSVDVILCVQLTVATDESTHPFEYSTVSICFLRTETLMAYTIPALAGVTDTQ